MLTIPRLAQRGIRSEIGGPLVVRPYPPARNLSDVPVRILEVDAFASPWPLDLAQDFDFVLTEPCLPLIDLVLLFDGERKVSLEVDLVRFGRGSETVARDQSIREHAVSVGLTALEEYQGCLAQGKHGEPFGRERRLPEGEDVPIEFDRSR